MKLPLIWFDHIRRSEKGVFSVELAEIASSIFDPLIVVVVFLAALLFYLKLPFVESLKWFVLTVSIAILPTVFYLAWCLKTHRVHDWFITERTERLKVLAVGLSSLVALNFILGFLESPYLLQVFVWIELLVGFILAVITFYWKVSFHTSAITFLATSLILLYGLKFTGVFILLIPVGWARQKLGKHTWSQLIAGAVITLVVTTLVFKWYYG